VLVGVADRAPVNPQLGEYYAALFVPPDATIGNYRIRWTFTVNNGDASQQVVMEFCTVSRNVNRATYSRAVQECINKLRVLLRDQNPDKFYHFRPPEHEGRIGQYNRVFGQIWEDAELACYLEVALDWWNMAPPETGELCSVDLLASRKPEWKIAILFGAIYWAMFAMSANWIADEFDYSIGGISLSIDKSAKYESLKSNAEGQWAKLIEQKLMTTKIIRGLQQPRFGVGIRSAFGPHVGRGILSPRSFV
jgi:hypothetical protein